MSKLQGLKFEVLKRRGKCRACNSELLSGTKTVLVGSFTNVYRYCLNCLSDCIEDNVDIKLTDGMLYLE